MIMNLRCAFINYLNMAVMFIELPIHHNEVGLERDEVLSMTIIKYNKILELTKLIKF